MLVLNLPFKALMFLTLMRPSLVLFLVLWLKLVKDFLKVRCRLALLPFLDRKSGSAGMPRPISYAVFCLKKKNNDEDVLPAASRSAIIDLKRAAFETGTPQDREGCVQTASGERWHDLHIEPLRDIMGAIFGLCCAAHHNLHSFPTRRSSDLSLVLFLVLWLKLVKDFLKVRCRLALLPFLISCLIWLDLVASLPLIKERILVIILLLHFLSLMLGSVLVLMLPLLVWLTPDLRIKKSLLKCNWTIRKRLPRCKMRLKKRLLAFSRRLHARIRKTRYMHKMRCLLINRRSLLLALRLLWKTPIFPSNSRFPRLCAKCLLKLKRLVSILPMTKSKK